MTPTSVNLAVEDARYVVTHLEPQDYDFVSNLCPIHAKGFVVTSIYSMFARERAHCHSGTAAFLIHILK